VICVTELYADFKLGIQEEETSVCVNPNRYNLKECIYFHSLFVFEEYLVLGQEWGGATRV